MHRARATFLLLIAIAISHQVTDAADPPALHEQINTLMESADGPRAPLADDATFARRASLGVIGRIPTRDELLVFVDDKSPTKRAEYVDRLLASDEYADHMAVCSTSAGETHPSPRRPIPNASRRALGSDARFAP